MIIFHKLKFTVLQTLQILLSTSVQTNIRNSKQASGIDSALKETTFCGVLKLFKSQILDFVAFLVTKKCVPYKKIPLL